jgi:hypothetical protein
VAIMMAFMSSTAFAYGQFGPGTTNPITWMHQIQSDGLSSQVQALEASAGFHRMDGSWSSFVSTRVIAAPIVGPADPTDFGEMNSHMYSVGQRMLPNGTVVFIVIPVKYTKADIRLSPTKGYKRIVVRVHIVGKSNCENAESGWVSIAIYIKIEVKHPKKIVVKHPKKIVKKIVVKHHKKVVKKIVCRSGSKLVGGSCVVQTQSCQSGFSWNGTQCVQQAASCPSGEVMNSNGNCVNQANTAEEACQTEGGSWNGNNSLCTITQVNGDCSTIIVVNGSGDTVSTNNSGNCNTTVPPAPTPAPTPASPTVTITSLTDLNMIPSGDSSGEFDIGVNASASGGSLTVDPGIGSVSSCDSTTPETSILLTVPSGNSTQCVILYAPDDSDQPSSMTATFTANLGTASDVKTQTFGITYPTRPS